MDKKVVFLNSSTAVVQVIVLSAIFLLLYSFLLKHIGIERLGVWSLVLATSSIANISNMGLSATVVKFVAKYDAHKQWSTIVDIIGTASITVASIIGCFAVLVYPFADSLLKFLLPQSHLAEARTLLPYSLVNLWLTGIASIVLSGIDGLQRTYLRSLLLCINYILYFVVCIILVPKYQLLGLGIAQLVQSLTLLISAFCILKSIMKLRFVIKWRYRLFREMLSYGINFQIMSIAIMSYEPMTKGLLARFGGLSAVGFYEMASRIVLQLRALVVNANVVLVPTVSFLSETDNNGIRKLYRKALDNTIFIAIPIWCMVIAFAPYLSELWIGNYRSEFVTFLVLLSVGWAINMLNVPAYVFYLGTGMLRWNVTSHIVMGVLNTLLGVFLGKYFFARGVVSGWVISLAVGSLIIPIAYHHTNRIPLRDIVSGRMLRLFGLCVAGVILTLLGYRVFRHSAGPMLLMSLSFIVFASMVLPFYWQNPIRRDIAAIISRKLTSWLA